MGRKRIHPIQRPEDDTRLSEVCGFNGCQQVLRGKSEFTLGRGRTHHMHVYHGVYQKKGEKMTLLVKLREANAQSRNTDMLGVLQILASGSYVGGEHWSQKARRR